MKSAPLQKIKAGCGSLGYRVERTSLRAGVSPAEVQRLSRRNVSSISSLILSTRFQDREIGHNVNLVKRVESDDARCRVCALHA
jgi:hypothetical protein